MRLLALVFLMIGMSAVGYKFLTSGGTMAARGPAPAGLPPIGTYKVVLYSNSECSPCGQRRRQLTADGIVFVEHLMDREPKRMEELMEKLSNANLPTSSVHLPQLEINGVMMQGNPTLKTIRAQLVSR